VRHIRDARMTSTTTIPETRTPGRTILYNPRLSRAAPALV
jgi:hypothetical protein